MNTSTSTRAVPRVLGLLAALVIVVAGAGSAAATGSPGPEPIIGSWNVRISIHVQEPPLQETATFTFTADHKFTTSNTSLPGEGIWQSNGRHVFTFWIAHPHPDAANPVGTTNALHLGRVDRNRLSTTATAYIVMLADGTWLGPITVRTEGTRVGG